jgi:hypothetical protein
MNYAIISTTGLVINIIEWDEATSWQPPAGHTAVATTEAGIGYTYANGTFTAPPEPPPGPTPPPAPNYIAFWNALIASAVYASIRTQSMTNLPMNTLATEFIALIGDAKSGHPNEAAIQASMSAVFATGTFTEDDAEEFTAALAAGYLDDTYTLGATE